MMEVAIPRKQILGARSRLSSSSTKRPPPSTLQMLLGESDAPVYMSAIVAATIAERIYKDKSKFIELAIRLTMAEL